MSVSEVLMLVEKGRTPPVHIVKVQDHLGSKQQRDEATNLVQGHSISPMFVQAAFFCLPQVILPNPRQAQMQIIISGQYTYASYINIVTLSFLGLC